MMARRRVTYDFLPIKEILDRNNIQIQQFTESLIDEANEKFDYALFKPSVQNMVLEYNSTDKGFADWQTENHTIGLGGLVCLAMRVFLECPTKGGEIEYANGGIPDIRPGTCVISRSDNPHRTHLVSEGRNLQWCCFIRGTSKNNPVYPTPGGWASGLHTTK